MKIKAEWLISPLTRPPCRQMRQGLWHVAIHGRINTCVCSSITRTSYHLVAKTSKRHKNYLHHQEDILKGIATMHLSLNYISPCTREFNRVRVERRSLVRGSGTQPSTGQLARNNTKAGPGSFDSIYASGESSFICAFMQCRQLTIHGTAFPCGMYTVNE